MPADVHRPDLSALLRSTEDDAVPPALLHLLLVVRRSAQPGLLSLLGQMAHQAAIADRALAPFNTDTHGRPYRNIHASFWFFAWHRAHLLALEQAARAETSSFVLPSSWGVPYWNITSPDAADVAEHLMRLYRNGSILNAQRRLSSRWEYIGPTEEEMLAANLSTLVGACMLTHSNPD